MPVSPTPSPSSRTCRLRAACSPGPSPNTGAAPVALRPSCCSGRTEQRSRRGRLSRTTTPYGFAGQAAACAADLGRPAGERAELVIDWATALFAAGRVPDALEAAAAGRRPGRIRQTGRISSAEPRWSSPGSGPRRSIARSPRSALGRSPLLADEPDGSAPAPRPAARPAGRRQRGGRRRDRCRRAGGRGARDGRVVRRRRGDPGCDRGPALRDRSARHRGRTNRSCRACHRPGNGGQPADGGLVGSSCGGSMPRSNSVISARWNGISPTRLARPATPSSFGPLALRARADRTEPRCSATSPASASTTIAPAPWPSRWTTAPCAPCTTPAAACWRRSAATRPSSMPRCWRSSRSHRPSH